MNKRYLGVWTDAEGIRRVDSLSNPLDTLTKPRGQVSPLFPALPNGRPFELPPECAIVLLVPRSSNELLAELMNDHGSDIRRRTFISHGHASTVVIEDSRESGLKLVASLRPHISGYEIWPLSNGAIVEDQVEILEPEVDANWADPDPIDSSSLKFEARAQVDQFNSNLMVLSRVARLYAPEIGSLVDGLRESIAEVATRLSELDKLDDDIAVREILGLEEHLVEANSVLTTYASQIGSGSLPLCEDIYPVGEYSLLGIGLMMRGAWRIYSHLNRTFSSHDHAGLIQRAYPGMPAFSSYSPKGFIDYSEWRKYSIALEFIDEEPDDDARQHMPYFSSRWGFHETWHAISLSWQCLYASATKEWNLLTLTHEYLHAHVRDIFGVIFEPEDHDLAGEIVAEYNSRGIGSNALRSMQLAYVDALVSVQALTSFAEEVVGTNSELRTHISETLTVEELRVIYRRHSELIHEVVVHILDFWYVYDGRDDVYVNSIWSSWSLVPSVASRIPYYVLRTLAALASTSDKTATPDIFDDACDRLKNQLKSIHGGERRRPVIGEAIRLLDDPVARRRLSVQFPAVRYVSELTLSFFKDGRLNAALVRDDLTAVLDGKRRYNIEYGSYLGQHITSPIGFLLDRFDGYREQAGDDSVDHESIWQMLQLV